MMALRVTSSPLQASVAKSSSSRLPAIAPSSVRAPIVACRASIKEDVAEAPSSRREVLGAAAMVASALMSASPAQAFLGFGEDDSKVQEKYLQSTTEVLQRVQVVLDMDKKDPAKEETVKELRKDINNWVAAYRREDKVSGRPSFGVTYSILNALAGHFNSFGPTAPIPKKRLERINKVMQLNCIRPQFRSAMQEMKDANLYLSRGR